MGTRGGMTGAPRGTDSFLYESDETRSFRKLTLVTVRSVRPEPERPLLSMWPAFNHLFKKPCLFLPVGLIDAMIE